MSKWQRHAEVCGEKSAENLFQRDPDATRQNRDVDMLKAGAVLLTFLREHDVPEDEIADAMSTMLEAHVMRFRQLGEKTKA